jgi:hypothetical protein
VRAPAHAAKGAQSVGSETHLFFLLYY